MTVLVQGYSFIFMMGCSVVACQMLFPSSGGLDFLLGIQHPSLGSGSSVTPSGERWAVSAEETVDFRIKGCGTTLSSAV